MTRIEIDGITKTFPGGKQVLSGVSFSINAGELFFLLGSSGCGKSTLLRIIAGLLKQDSGRIIFNGKDISALPPEKRRTPMVFQNYALWPHLDVFENTAFGLRAAGMPEKVIRQRVEEMLEAVQLGGFSSRQIVSLSGGQQQRVALARALAVRPEVLLLDEPLSNLDANLRDAMRFEIRRICKEQHLTAIYVTHDRQEALSMGDKIALLHEGKLCQTGTPEELYYRPESIFAAGFLGDINLIPAAAMTGDWADTAAGPLKLRPGALKNFPEGRRFTLAFRPEMLRRAAASDGMENVFACRIEQKIFLGEKIEYHLSGATGKLKMFSPVPLAESAGEEIALFIAPAAIGVLTR